MDQNQSEDETILIMPHQELQFRKLCAIGRVAFHFDAKQFPLSLRTNIMVTGPSGSGKTHISREVARSLNVPYLYISISEWVLLGCSNRGAEQTWPRIIKFILTSCKKNGALIILDEIDKLHGSNEWVNYQRTEVFSLLDRQIPTALQENDDLITSEDDKNKVKSFLRHKIMIIGVGAFQQIWDNQSKTTMGFIQDSVGGAPDLAHLATSLPRELVNRFSSNLITLPPLRINDYQAMLQRIASGMPVLWKTKFEAFANEKISEACRLQQGPRFFEELLLEMVVREKLEITDSFQTDICDKSIELGNV